MAEALKEAKAAEKEAIDALEKAKGKVPEKELQKAIALIKRDGIISVSLMQEEVHIIRSLLL